MVLETIVAILFYTAIGIAIYKTFMHLKRQGYLNRVYAEN